MEIWKEISGYEGLYEVSNTGNVKNSIRGNILTPGMSQGYEYVALYKNGIRKNKQVNRLVAEAFIENPDGHPLVHHKDEIKTNNNVDNLEWQSYLYNNTYNDIAKRRSAALKGRPAWNKGKKMSESFRQKVSEGRKRYLANKNTMEDLK
jgi:hypothetical protein